MPIAGHFVHQLEGSLQISTPAKGFDHGVVENEAGDEMVLCQLLPQPGGIFEAKFGIGTQSTTFKEGGVDANMPGKGPCPELTVQLESLGGMASLGASVNQDPEMGLQRFHPLLLHLRQKCKSRPQIVFLMDQAGHALKVVFRSRTQYISYLCLMLILLILVIIVVSVMYYLVALQAFATSKYTLLSLIHI